MKNFNKILYGPMAFLLMVAVQGCDPGYVPSESSKELEIPQPTFSTFYALGENNTLYELDIKNPSQTGTAIKIETREAEERIVAIDFRPATGQLYALSHKGQMYSVNLNYNRISAPMPVNRSAVVEAEFTAKSYAFDFNPLTDRIRLITDKWENLGLHPNTGALDKDHGNPKGIATPEIKEVAYTNNYSGAPDTKLYGIDPVTDKLFIYTTKEANCIEEVGDLGMDIAEVSGFDIAPRTSKGKEFAMASVRVDDAWELIYIDLESGKTKKIGDLPDEKIKGIAIPTQVAYAVDIDHNLLSFNPMDSLEKDPEHLIIQKPITGLPAAVKIIGIDMSVENFPRLYAMADNSHLFEINTTTGQATLKCALTVPIDLTNDPAFGIDFNPFQNDLRVVISTKHAFEITIENGEVVNFGALTLNKTPISLDAAAYSNSQVGLKSYTDTELYGIDTETKSLYRKYPTINEVQKMADLRWMKSGKLNGFDIGGLHKDNGYALFGLAGKTALYQFSLSTSSHKVITEIPHQIVGFALGRYINDKNGL